MSEAPDGEAAQRHDAQQGHRVQRHHPTAEGIFDTCLDQHIAARNGQDHRKADPGQQRRRQPMLGRQRETGEASPKRGPAGRSLRQQSLQGFDAVPTRRGDSVEVLLQLRRLANRHQRPGPQFVLHHNLGQHG